MFWRLGGERDERMCSPGSAPLVVRCNNSPSRDHAHPTLELKGNRDQSFVSFRVVVRNKVIISGNMSVEAL
jgi:hypothetical protein